MKHCYWSLLILTLLIFTGCSKSEKDPCDVPHIVINGECVPEYIFPPNVTLANGAKYYHQKYGVIIYVNGDWFDTSERIIKDLEIKTEQ